jgi:exodeoxyribonuclease VII small subunit
MPKTASPASDMSYEQALQELESLVQRMDSGEMPLDGLLAAYQRGAELLKICRDKLAAVEEQVKRIDATISPSDS